MTKTHVVIGGGGVYGIALLGALAPTYKSITHFSGTSAGAVISICLCLYTPEELLKELDNFQFFPDESIDFGYFLEEYGFVDGGFLLDKVDELIHKKTHGTVKTLLDLYKYTGKTVHVCGTNLSTQQAEYFYYETHPTMNIRDALKISTSIPLVMKKVEYKGCLYTDGGVSDNFPLKPFLNVKSSKILGIRIKILPNNVNPSFQDYIGLLVCTLIHKSTPISIDTIVIPIMNLEITKRLTYEEVHELYRLGKRCYDDSICNTES